MKRIIFYFSFLMICSCNCDSGSKVDNTPTTGYNVTFPDGKTNSVDVVDQSKGKKAPANVSVQQPTNNSEAAKRNNVRKPNSGGESSFTATGKTTATNGNTKGATGQKSRTSVNNNRAGTKTVLNNVLPTACDLIDIAWLTKLLDAKEQINTTNSSSKKNPNVNSCFFRWANGIIPNSGIFLQISENPLPEEITEYATYFIQGKLEGGEMDMHGENYKYSPYKTVGITGAFNKEQGKYFWQVGPERVFMLAFNTGNSGNKEMKWADAIAKHVMDAYAKKQ